MAKRSTDSVDAINRVVAAITTDEMRRDALRMRARGIFDDALGHKGGDFEDALVAVYLAGINDQTLAAPKRKRKANGEPPASE